MKYQWPVLGALSLVAVALTASQQTPAQFQAASMLPTSLGAPPGLRLALNGVLPGPGTGTGTGTGKDAGKRPASAKAAGSAAAVLGPVSISAADADATAGAAGAAEGGARGVVRAVREATLSSRLAGRIEDMPLAEGTSFKAGDLLVKFDCERQTAEARAAAAAVDVQKKTVDTNEELDKFESIGKNDLSISKSQLDKARAESDALKSQLKDCRLVAPFSGRVIERLAHNFEAVSASQPLLRVVDTSALELELIVPSAWLQWLSEGASFKFRIDETGQTVAGSVARLTPTVDPVSKTIKVIGRFHPGKGVNQVLPGMSGSAVFAGFATATATTATAAANGSAKPSVALAAGTAPALTLRR